jgi:membrane protein
VLLVWVYYSTQIFLLGAEFTWVYANTFGSRKGKDKLAEESPEVPARDSLDGGHDTPARDAVR